MEPSQERRLDQWGDNPSPSLKPFDSGWGGGLFSQLAVYSQEPQNKAELEL